MTCPFVRPFVVLVDAAAEGEGGRALKLSSGSRRARLAAGGDVGGVRIGDLEGDAISKRLLDFKATVSSSLAR